MELTILTLPLLTNLNRVLLLAIKLLVFVLEIVDLGIELSDILVELGLLELEHVSLALLVLMSPQQRFDLDLVLLILLLESLVQGFFLVKLDLFQAE